MHNHFDKNLNLKQIILEHKPACIVECGAGTGENTRLIQSLMDDYDFKLHVISDASIGGLRDGVSLLSGISYIELERFPDESIDLCIIDTDHNYWTLAKELTVLDTKLADGGLIALHDTWFCYHDTGMAMSYSDGTVYPVDDIKTTGLTMGGLGDALIDFLHAKRFSYSLIAYTTASNGATVIQKKALEYVNIYEPAKDAPYVGSSQYEKSLV